MWPSSGTPVSSGTSRIDSTTLRLPPTSPTVSRSPARVDLRMIAHASCSRSASIASRTFVACPSDMREPYFRESFSGLRCPPPCRGSPVRFRGELPSETPELHGTTPAILGPPPVHRAVQGRCRPQADDGVRRGFRRRSTVRAWLIVGIRGVNGLPDSSAPVGIDPEGIDGPTEDQARGPRWRQTSSGMYVPRDVDRRQWSSSGSWNKPVGSRAYGAVTGWAALRWHGATFFDGTAEGGRKLLPVSLVVHSKLRPRPAVHLHRGAAGPDRVVVGRRIAGHDRPAGAVRRGTSHRQRAREGQRDRDGRGRTLDLDAAVRGSTSPAADPGQASRAPGTPYAWLSTTAARHRSSGC